jgi:hypothetical protein
MDSTAVHEQVQTTSQTMQKEISEPQKSTGTIGKVLFVLLAVGAIGYLGYENYMLKQKVLLTAEQAQTKLPFSTPSVVPISSTESAVSKWSMAKYGGVFSYEYPTGWHVVELWPDGSGPISIVMNPEPINTAPGDVQLGAFDINFWNGLPKPADKLAELKADFGPQNYTDIVSEVIAGDAGQIQYFSGKIAGEYRQGAKVETYIFSLKKSANDPQNEQVIKASLIGEDMVLSDLLRHIVLSFKIQK